MIVLEWKQKHVFDACILDVGCEYEIFFDVDVTFFGEHREFFAIPHDSNSSNRIGTGLTGVKPERN